MTVSTEPVEALQEEPAPPADSTVIRVAGLFVVAIATLVTAIVELYLTPLRIAGVPVGASVLFAVVINWTLAWFALRTTRRRWAVGVPWVLWTVIMLFAAGAKTTEGDYLLSGTDWIALVMILAGSLAFAVFAYRMILGKVRL